jgi:hypothetical protein
MSREVKSSVFRLIQGIALPVSLVTLSLLSAHAGEPIGGGTERDVQVGREVD